jgi:signal peptidase I
VRGGRSCGSWFASVAMLGQCPVSTEAAHLSEGGRVRRSVDHAVRGLLGLVSLVLLALVVLLTTGFQALIVRTGSMAPTINTGDLIVVREIPPSDAAVGDIITFRDPTRADAVVTHRVVNVRRDGSTFRFVTKGDANGAEERWSIGAEETMGSYLASIPKVGYFIGWIGLPGARAGLLVAAAVILLFVGVRRLWERHKVRTKGQSKPSKKRLRHALVLMAVWSIGVVMGYFANSTTQGAFSDAASNSGNAFTIGTWACTAPGSQTVSAVADTDVKSASPTSNFGTALKITIKSQITANQRTLVRFSLPAIPANCSVSSATLRLYASSSDSGRTLAAYRAVSSWTEAGVVWNNQPATVGSASTTTSGLGWRTWDVTAHVQTMYSGTNYGFIVKDAAEGSLLGFLQEFSSRENSTNPPELVVNWG